MQEHTHNRFDTEVNTHSDGHLNRQAAQETDGEYRINLSVFEGPIDLLFYLIKKNELDIHEVSLAKIAKEYLDYVELIKLIDLERAGDFIVIASTLMKIKSRSLFSLQESDGAAADESEVRQELIKYLLEYQKLGGAAEKLAEKEALRQGIYPRGGERKRILDSVTHVDQAADYMLFDLLTAFRDVLATTPKTEIHQVELLNITSEMKQREIMDLLKQNGKIEFISLVENQPRLIIVVTFIAMLELIKAKKIRVRQTTQYGRILLYERTDNTDKDN